MASKYCKRGPGAAGADREKSILPVRNGGIADGRGPGIREAKMASPLTVSITVVDSTSPRFEFDGVP
jgi:hypothetical protein